MRERLNAILEAHPYLAARPSADCRAFNCPPEHLIGLLTCLRDEHGFDFLTDVTAIDHQEARPRFEVLYHLYSTERHDYLRLATPCADDQQPACPSVTALWPTADWHEREAYDMFGIRFAGHPDLRRILMWDGYPYFPLRKEFPLAGLETPFPSEDLTEATGASVLPAPMLGGPFHSAQGGPMSAREPRAGDQSWTETRPRPAAAEGAPPGAA